MEIGDTVKVKNKSDKHKASDIFIVTSKNDKEVGIQKLLHPLKKTPPKFMGKIYNTKTKLLHTSHPRFKLEDRNLASDLAANFNEHSQTRMESHQFKVFQ